MVPAEDIKAGEKTAEKPGEAKAEEKQSEKPGEAKAEEKPKIERIYTIPLGDVYNQPWTKRARKAVRMVREFLQRHTKKDVKIDNEVNAFLWSRGMKHPPRKIRVGVEIEDNVAIARLIK